MTLAGALFTAGGLTKVSDASTAMKGVAGP